MGAWGPGPYDNDGSADWFGDLWDKFTVPAFVEKTLNLEVEDHHEEIRAAAYVLAQLGHVYSWPVHDIDRHHQLAAAKLEEIAKMDIYEDPDFQEMLKSEAAFLRSRISNK